ncbi:hypothetical protein GCM10023206_30200 [Acinetobacter puyangensis]|uniref:Uncharacterized protein n=1 Tax=Acinetobacter puyangensis TaxID=1096779 RepID=A0A240E358_9GAMM|nr:hypothetical protein [Acinetobacter puyangensis]SNX43214.1 hypothetical protein SAMN05421731_101249 [Acinetobacter puyangensis]
MASNNVIQVRGKNYNIYEFTGKVAHSNKQLETVVSGGGGGGATYQGTGGAAPVRISSTTYTHDDIFLVNDQGQEHVLRLVDWDIATREGHIIQAIWLIKEGKDEGSYVAINNLSTNTLLWGDRGRHGSIGKLVRPEWWKVFILPIVILVASAMIISWLSIVLVIVYFYFVVHKPWKDDIQSVKNQLKPFIQSA